MATPASAVFPEQIGEEDMRVTPAARAKLSELQGQAEEDVTAIRVFVSGGGCSGMTYGMTYTDRITPYDSVVSGPGFTLAVDAVALNYLRGCEIDFRSDTLNPSFVFNNVFQSVGGTGTCGGCGGGGRF
ncbi:MAG: iron-sulfur cluster assembly accessory protein [Gammaproteobacteria bacterium]|nr:iron-sulfur cluster assembly accessory protein [Gammaproteobacteria bacterium]